LLNFTETAREKLDEFAASSDEPSLALKIAIIGRGENGFQYDLQLIPSDDAEDGDEIFEVGSWTVIIAEKSVPYMDDVTLGFKETLMGGGFHFENPNPLWLDEVATRVQEIIDTEVSPTVASHGGTVSLIDVRDGEVIVAFGGGCQGCSAVDITLKNGVEKIIKEHIPEIVSISDITDHATGENPFC
jgi:Fe/S biogenesis protein NfuA